METFYIEVTDTFGGMPNYSWVSRYTTKAKSAMGAIRKLGNHTGLSFRKDYDDGLCTAYLSKSGATIAFVSYADPDIDHPPSETL